MQSRLFLSFSIIAIVIVMAVSISAIAQSDTRFQIWTDFNPRIKLNEKLSIVGDVGYRIETGSNIQIFYVRPGLRYSPIKMISFDAGVANFNRWNAGVGNSVELRTFEYIFLNWPTLWKFKFKFRFGLDQRWFHFGELSLDKFVHRSRLRIGLRSPDLSLNQGSFKLYITSNVEFLRDINDDEIEALIDHNRFMIGLGSNLNNKIRAEFQFQIIGLNDTHIGEFIRDVNMIRIRVFYSF